MISARAQFIAAAAAATALEVAAMLMPRPRDPGKRKRTKQYRPVNYIARRNKVYKLKGIRP